MFELLMKGGPVMIPICLSALFATVIVIERALFFRSAGKGDGVLFKKVKDLVVQDRCSEALGLCEADDGPLARVLAAAVGNRDYPEAHLREAVLNAANREVPRVERYISALGTVANVSTLLGLLGTVVGNIRAFGVLSGGVSAMGNPTLLAGAIADVLIATAAGLVVSIPATVFYSYYMSRANRMVTDMESSAGDLTLTLLARRRTGVPGSEA